ncbi:MAG: autotransporter-associated beta strand repeat-containing protein, partial [Planctomycetota bacterium]|nr:autotransporter-associated beta strand repeat-containing protein [Planctomycetota bacterium]
MLWPDHRGPAFFDCVSSPWSVKRFLGTEAMGLGSVPVGSGAHIISPGDHGSVGVLHTGSLYLTSNTTLDFSDITSTTVMDQIISAGSLNFNGSGAAAILLPGTMGAGTYRLIDCASAGTALATNFSMPGAPSNYSLQIDSTNHDLGLIVETVGMNHWIGASGATWTNTGNWSLGTIPNGQGAAAGFTGNGGATVSVNGTVTVGSILFDGSQSYNIAGGTSPRLVFDNGAGSATILMNNGAAAQAISTPVTLNSNLTVTNSSSNGLTFSGGISGTNKGITLAGGLLVLQGTNTYTGATNINAGILRLGVANALPTSGVTNINPGGTLDRGGYSITPAGLNLAGGTLGGSGTLTLSADLTGFGTITGGTANLGGGSRAITVNGFNALTIADQITGTGPMAKSGTGTLVLANVGAANNWTGGALVVNAGTLKNGASNQIPDGLNVTVASGATWDLNGYSEKITDLTYTASGTVNLNGGTLELTNVLGGSGLGHFNNIAGTGALILSGGHWITDNTIHWDMTGVIYITGGAALTAGHGDATGTILASDVYVTNGKLALMNTDNRLIPTVKIHMSSAGTMLMKQDQGWTDPGVNQTVAVLEGTGGTVNNNDTTAAHMLTVNQTSGTYSFGGLLTNGAYALTIVKSGAGTWVLTGANTYTGSTTISAGALRIGNASALGTVAGGTTVASGAALQIYNNITTLAEPLTLSGTGVANDGALRNISDTNTFSGPITLGAASRIDCDSGTLTLNAINGPTFGLTLGGAGNITVNGAITLTSGGLFKAGLGTATLMAANTFTGGMTVSAGTLRLGISNALPSGGKVTVQGGSTLDIDGYGSSPGTITLIDGTIAGTTAVLTGSSYDVRKGTVSATLGGTGGLTKTTADTVTLAAANSYTGATTISGGILRATSGAGLPSASNLVLVGGVL